MSVEGDSALHDSTPLVESSAARVVTLQLPQVVMTVLNASTDAVVITDVDATIVSVRANNGNKLSSILTLFFF